MNEIFFIKCPQGVNVEKVIFGFYKKLKLLLFIYKVNIIFINIKEYKNKDHKNFIGIVSNGKFVVQRIQRLILSKEVSSYQREHLLT